MKHPNQYQVHELLQIRVLIADRYPAERSGIRKILSENPRICIVGEVDPGRQAIEFVQSRPCDLVVFDADPADRDHPRILGKIRQAGEHLAILALSSSDEELAIGPLIRAGANGLFLKSDPDGGLRDAALALVRGRQYLSPSLEQRFGSELFTDAAQLPHECLSLRERQVMSLMSTGKSVTEIGVELSLSIKTISTYRSRIFDKLRISSNAHLIRYALAHHLVMS